MLLGAFISLIACVMMVAAGFRHWPVWCIAIGGLLFAFAGISRAFISANGTIALQALGYAEALVRGFEQRQYEGGVSKIRRLVVGQFAVGAVTAAVLYAIGIGLRRYLI